ncbi:MAG: SDR family NAD(P)-dependent oxidoreductase, partial [Syntrophales bacterium]
MRLKEKVIIVTGAAQGLGKAFSLALAREGAKIVVVDIADSGATEKEIEASGSEVRALRTDVSSPEETQRMAEETVRTFGRIDVLVNCAAIVAGLRRKPFFEIDPAEWDKVMAVNVKGPWLCT